IWEGTTGHAAGVPTSDEVLNSRTKTELDGQVEARLIAAITRPLLPDENHLVGNTNRERELAQTFVDLSITDAYKVRCRLQAGREGDPLVRAFRRLLTQRQHRLLTLLVNHRRYAAIGKR
ncbi:MAG TPA: hypothetical protein VF403_17640, partial [Kofleriaceae bacterium]